MTCGKIEAQEGGNYKGHYKVWAKPRLEFTFQKNADKGEKAPDFIVQAKDPCGDLVDIGHAYKNEIKKGEKTGLPCFSVYFENPGLFKEPLKLSAFPSKPDGSEFALEYDTSEKPQRAEQGAPTNEYQFEGEKKTAA